MGRLDSFSIRRVPLFRDKTTLDQRESIVPSWPIGKREDLGRNNIRLLSIDGCGPSSREPQDEYGLIVDCQQIQSLTWKNWRVYNSYHRTTPLVQDLRKGWWPFLECLHLPWTELSDQDISMIILAMDERPLRELGVEGTEFGQLSTRALLWRDVDVDCNLDTTLIPLHRLLLEDLYLTSCDNLTGSMIQQILCSFPNLRRFKGTALTVADVIADPRPWVCTQLETLHLCFGLEVRLDNVEDLPTTTDTAMDNIKSPSHIFFDRLGTLFQLEVLRPMNYGPYGRTPMLLSHRSDIELKVLSSLRRLKLVGWDNMNRLLALKDVKLMVEIWPALETLHLSNRFGVQSEAVEFLRTHGIQWKDDGGPWRLREEESF